MMSWFWWMCWLLEGLIDLLELKLFHLPLPKPLGEWFELWEELYMGVLLVRKPWMNKGGPGRFGLEFQSSAAFAAVARATAKPNFIFFNDANCKAS